MLIHGDPNLRPLGATCIHHRDVGLLAPLALPVRLGCEDTIAPFKALRTGQLKDIVAPLTAASLLDPPVLMQALARDVLQA